MAPLSAAAFRLALTALWLRRCASDLQHGALPSPAACNAQDSLALLQDTLQSRLEAEPALEDDSGCPVPDWAELKFKTMEAIECPVGGSLRQERLLTCGGDPNGDLEPGSKEVYFLRHTQPECCPDCGLARIGLEQCEALKENNTLLNQGPLSESTPAEVVISSPSTRALETALRIFGDLPAKFEIDSNLVETFGYNNCTSCVSSMLAATNHTELLDEYQHLFTKAAMPPSYWSDKHKKRIEDFTQSLRERPEKRFVVVSHHYLMQRFDDLGLGCMAMGEMVARTSLDRRGKWRMLSEDTCNGRRRRWPYGNYRRQRAADPEP